jgi:hypothetical protein
METLMSSNELNTEPASCRVTYTLWDRIKNVLWAIIAALAAATVDYLFPEASQWIIYALWQIFTMAVQYAA